MFSENVSKAIKPRKKSVNESNEVALIKVHLSKVNRKVRTSSEFQVGDSKGEEDGSCEAEDQVLPDEIKLAMAAKFEDEDAANTGSYKEEMFESEAEEYQTPQFIEELTKREKSASQSQCVRYPCPVRTQALL